MPTTNFTVTKDTRIARRESDNYDSGAGTGTGLAFGLYSGYRYRALLGFNINMAGWTSITSAVFHYKTSDQINVAFGSDPTMLIQRITAAWSEGSASALSASNATIYPGPSATSTNQVEEDAPTGENTWGEVAITGIMRDALTTGVFHGIRILGSTNTSVESDSSANVGEIYAREGSGDAYITIVYETNRAPDVPTISSPDVGNGGLVASQTPALHVYMTDPDGNAINNYHWQIDDNADFSSPIQDVYGGVAGPSGSTAVVVPAALTRGGTYYFRAQAADVSVWGPWSGTFSFKVASVPSLTVSEPSASGRLVRLHYSAGAGWGSPRMGIDWSMTCPDGGTQATWRVEVYNDSAGSPSGMIEDVTANDTTSSRVVPYNLIEGNYYHVRVWATCSHGLTAAVGWLRVRARWGYSVHRFDMGATAIGSLALTTLDVTDESSGGSGRVAVEYQTSTGTGIPSTWSGSIGGAGLNRYFFYRVFLMTWGASPSVSPTLNELKITYSTSIIVPDKWQVNDSNNVVGDVSSFVYGTKSLRMKGIANWLLAHQQIAVVPNTYYVLSGRIQTSGPVTAAYVGFATNGSGGGDLVQAQVDITKAIPFENPASRVFSTPWFSGSSTSVWVRLSSYAPVGTSVWFDAIKAEASTVVTPWSPGYVANAVVLDSGGLQIDGSNGGIFRLRGMDGAARSVVELGARGLVFGTDELWSPANKVLAIAGGVQLHSSGSAAFGAGGGTENWWWKAGSGVIPYQYGAVNFMGTAMMGGANGPNALHNSAALVYGAIYQGDVLGTQPYTHLKVLATGEWVPSDFKIVITSVGAGGAAYEFWVKSPYPWFTPYFKLEHLAAGFGGEMWTNGDGNPLVAAASAGTAYIGTAWESNSGQGSAFPDQAMDKQRFFHTGYNMEFFWDSPTGRWCSVNLYEHYVDLQVSNSWTTASAQGVIKNYIPVPAPLGVQALPLFMYGFQAVFNVAAGTALSASNWWYLQVNFTPNDNFVGYYEIKTGAQGVWRREGNTRSAIFVPVASTNLYFMVGKNGAPPNISLTGFILTYRALGN